MDYQFEYVEGTDHQIKVLYKDWIESTISHKAMPGYDAHNVLSRTTPTITGSC